MTQRGLGLLNYAGLTRKQLIAFALLSAVLNGIITASVGAWLGQTYAKYQARKQSIESWTSPVSVESRLLLPDSGIERCLEGCGAFVAQA